jgi:hypothetical protein
VGESALDCLPCQRDARSWSRRMSSESSARVSRFSTPQPDALFERNGLWLPRPIQALVPARVAHQDSGSEATAGAQLRFSYSLRGSCLWCLGICASSRLSGEWLSQSLLLLPGAVRQCCQSSGRVCSDSIGLSWFYCRAGRESGPDRPARGWRTKRAVGVAFFHAGGGLDARSAAGEEPGEEGTEPETSE